MQHGGLNKPLGLSENKPVRSGSTMGLPAGLNTGHLCVCVLLCVCVYVLACVRACVGTCNDVNKTCGNTDDAKQENDRQ